MICDLSRTIFAQLKFFLALSTQGGSAYKCSIWRPPVRPSVNSEIPAPKRRIDLQFLLDTTRSLWSKELPKQPILRSRGCCPIFR